MRNTVLVIGGYGGVGQVLCRDILANHDCQLLIGGRSLSKTTEVRDELLIEFPSRQIEAVEVDATNKKSLTAAMKGADLVIVAASIPDYITLVAEAALETATDMLDILVRGDVVDQLSKYKTEITSKGRRFFTQGGFHPGIIAPLISSLKVHFDDYQSAEVFLAMDPTFNRPESSHEVFYEVVKGAPRLL